MKLDIEHERTVRGFLLDTLPAKERRRLEERLLDDGDDFHEQLQFAEEELADDYVAGFLSDDERERFEQVLLPNPEWRAQVRFAASLSNYLAPNEPLKKTASREAPPSPTLFHRMSQFLGFYKPSAGLAFAGALVLLASVSAWLVLERQRLREEMEGLRAQRPSAPPVDDTVRELEQRLAAERDRRAEIEEQLRRERVSDEQKSGQGRATSGQASGGRNRSRERGGQSSPPGAATRVLAIALTPGSIREAGTMPVVKLKPSTKVVQLRLDTSADDYVRYTATLETVEGKSLLTRRGLRAIVTREGRIVVFDVPAKLIESGGDLLLRLGGQTARDTVEEAGTYYFRVVPN